MSWFDAAGAGEVIDVPVTANTPLKAGDVLAGSCAGSYARRTGECSRPGEGGMTPSTGKPYGKFRACWAWDAVQSGDPAINAHSRTTACGVPGGEHRCLASGSA